MTGYDRRRVATPHNLTFKARAARFDETIELSENQELLSSLATMEG